MNTVNKTMSIKNSQRRISRISFLVAVLLFLIFWLTLNEGNYLTGKWVISFLSIFSGVTSLVTAIIFRSRAKKLDALLSRRQLIAQWELTMPQTKQYASYLKQTAMVKNKATMWVVLVLFIVISIPFLFFLERDEIGGFIIIMGSILVVIFLASKLFPIYYYFTNLRGDRKVLIGSKYAYINGYFHNWDFPLSGLKSVKPITEPFTGIMLKYYYTDRTWRNEHTLYIPSDENTDRFKLAQKIRMSQ